MKIGRNELCPCGSGKKFKKCCIPRYEKKPKVIADPRRFNRNHAGLLITQFLAMADMAGRPRNVFHDPPQSLEDLE